ncbi:MAG: type 1 glutamine amidotransferase [Candidatus Omnitrophica bacterium]|nr:type 1 glutamine amidotransferase [Candidatus Omnitrophota bacterium]
MSLQGQRVAILVEDCYQDLEVWYPYYRLKEAGAAVVFVGTGKPKYTGKYGYPLTPETSADRVSAQEFDGIIVPGGWAPDLLRRDPAVIQLVSDANRQGKVIGAICHAGWVLCSANVLRGRTATCFSAIRDDVVNAGANYVDREVVRDGNLITSRTPDDLPAFLHAIIEALHARPAAPARPARRSGQGRRHPAKASARR